MLEVRRGEGTALARSIAVVVLLIAALTTLETARDALLLTHLAPRLLGVVYVAVAAVALPAAALSGRVSERLGLGRTMGLGLIVTAGALLFLYFVHTTLVSVLVLYVTSTMIGTVLVPLFWGIVGATFTVSQGRRLLGTIAAAGSVGGAIGSTAAAGLLTFVRVKALLPSAAALLVVAALLVMPGAPAKRSGETADGGQKASFDAVRDDPFLRRIGLLVFASTAAAVLVDYLFKWTVAQTTARHEVAPLVARFYVVLNVLPIVAQLAFTNQLVRRIGIARSLVVTPLFLLVGSIGTLLAGAGVAPVLMLRGLDGTLRTSLHRVTTELAYLPLPATARARVKPFLDGFLTRATQGLLGAMLVGLAGENVLGRQGLIVLAALALGGWLLVASTAYRPYLDLLRRAMASGRPMDAAAGLDPLDLETAETLVQQLASFDSAQVVGAMNVLARRKRTRLIPALVLLHEAEEVVVRALRIFAASERDDWVPRARRLMGDRRESVRTAAVRALAAARRLRAEDVAGDESARIRGHAALHLARGQGTSDVLDDPLIREVLAGEDDARIGLLEAIGAVEEDERLTPLLNALAARAGTSRAWNEALATAASAQKATGMVRLLIERLHMRDGREIVRSALVSLGQPALGAVWSALLEPSTGRALRVHLPSTLARFGNKEAASLLLRLIEGETDGFVRYKAIRALGRLVAETGIRVDRRLAERLSHRNLLEHFRLLGLRAQFDDMNLSSSNPGSEELTARLLVGLLDDKLRQSLERTFRLLKIAHPREDIHAAHVLGVSSDPRARAHAAEFLDTLLRRRDSRPLRDLLRIVLDDVSNAARVQLAAGVVPYRAPTSREEALLRLVKDADAVVSSLASLHVAALEGKAARIKVGRTSLENRYA